MDTNDARRAMGCGRQGGWPRYLYKYRDCDLNDTFSLQKVRDILVGSSLWLAAPISFNDPFDLAANVTFDGPQDEMTRHLHEKLHRTFPDQPEADRARTVAAIMADPRSLIKGAQDAINHHLGTTGVVSLAEDPCNILMWSHYARLHQGICIQFEVPGSPAVFAAALPVKYSEEYPVLNWAKETSDQINSFILRKSCLWKYEREFRILIPEAAHISLPFAPKACTAVILGCRAPTELAQFILQCNSERLALGNPPLKIFRARQSPKAFRLTVHRVWGFE